MNKFLTIFKSEYAQVVRKKSFLVGILLTPAFMILITMLPAFLANRQISTPINYAIIDIDGRGVGKLLSKSLEGYKLDDDSTVSAYALFELHETEKTEPERIDSLRNRLDSLILEKEIKQYVMIFPNVEHSDSVLLVAKSVSFKSTGRFDRRISDILAAMRLDKSNINLSVDSVLTMTRRIDMIQESPGGKTRDFLSIYFSALIFVMIIFMSVIGFGQILMRSVIEEKSSRVMEVLISSVSPFQLMMGKVMGLGAANLTQIGIWVVLGMGLFMFRGNLQIPEQVSGIIFNPVLIFFFVVYLLIAFLMYSTLFALVGSICSTDKETQYFVFPITMTLLLPVMILMYIVQEPDSTITTILSFIPLMTPTMMVARLNISMPEAFTLADPIVLEAALGVIITSVFVVGLIWITSRVFRMGILMYGKRATLPEIMKWIRYK